MVGVEGWAGSALQAGANGKRASASAAARSPYIAEQQQFQHLLRPIHSSHQSNKQNQGPELHLGQQLGKFGRDLVNEGPNMPKYVLLNVGTAGI
jgi:hypothetical protein